MLAWQGLQDGLFPYGPGRLGFSGSTGKKGTCTVGLRRGTTRGKLYWAQQ